MNDKNKPLWHGVVLVAGGAIGAGMFALPLVASGAWYLWSVLGLLLVWWFTYLAAKLLIEVNLQFDVGSSFDTLVRCILGPRWALLNNVSIAFIMFILMYAYITAGARILSATSILALSSTLLSLVFAISVAALIYLGTSIVSRVSTVLMVAMVLGFLSANAGLFAKLDLTSLVSTNSVANARFLAATVPVFVTAFACAGLVPSLISHYPAQRLNVTRSIFYGSLIALLVYSLWLTTTLGNISRPNFAQVASDGGGLAALLKTLSGVSNSENLTLGLTWFSHFAVVTSFLSIALGLVHFLSDRFNFADTPSGKLYAVLAAFAPPTLFSVLLPYGFVKAIGFAGLFVAFSFFIVPALMHAKQFPCNNRVSSRALVVGFGLLVVALKLASIVSILPAFPD